MSSSFVLLSLLCKSCLCSINFSGTVEGDFVMVAAWANGFLLLSAAERLFPSNEIRGVRIKQHILLHTCLKSGFLREYSTGFTIDPSARVNGDTYFIASGKRRGCPIAYTKVVQMIGSQLRTNITAITLNIFAILASEQTLFPLSQGLFFSPAWQFWRLGGRCANNWKRSRRKGQRCLV